jgi:putative tricarboxylic transport membrane protein
VIERLPPFSRRSLLVGGAALAATIATGARAAGDFPNRPLSILVPANPGGGWDQLARLMQEVIVQNRLAPMPIDVFNKGGAGGAIGLADLVTRKHDDPYTIMAAGSVLLGSTISQASPFRASDAKPLARLIVENLVVAVPANSPLRTIEDLLDAYRTDPGSFTWCGGSAGGVDHILIGLITEACGISPDKMRYVAYSGGGEASAAIMGGQVTAAVAGYGEWRGLAESGHIRILASSAPERFGDGTIPTLREVGLDIELQNWRGLFAAPGAGAEAVTWWTNLIRRMRDTREWQDLLVNKGWEDGYLDAAAFAAFIRAEETITETTLARIGIGGSGGGNSPLGPWGMPKAIAGLAAVAAIGVGMEYRRGISVGPAGLEDDDDGGGELPVWSRFLAGALLIPLYLVALSLVGFVFATPVFVLAICLLMKSRTLKWDVVAAFGLTGMVWLLFTRLLNIFLP